MSSWRIKVGNDPTVEEWLKAQKSKSGSVQFLIKIFAHLHGNSDITKMSFNELFETGECNEQRYEVTGEAKVGATASTGECNEQRCEATDTVKVGAIASTGECNEQRYEVTGECNEQRYEVTGECNEQRYEVTGEAKVGAKPPLPVEKKSQEQREPSQKEKKKDNMLLSML